MSLFRVIFKQKALLVILIAGLVLRLAFVFWGAKIYYGHDGHVNGDTFSYTQSFINWHEKGEYTFDLKNDDAHFGRLPGYPAFYGIHYVLFSEQNANAALSITQAILDTLSIFLIYQIGLLLFRKEIFALASAIVYAFNPFVIVWIPVVGSESLATFITILFFYLLLIKKNNHSKDILLGGVAAMAFYVRPYLGILTVSIVLYYFLGAGITKSFFRHALLAAVTFLICYSAWPLRNYFNYNRVELLMPSTTGYDRYSADIVAARAWIYCWSPDADFYLDEIAQGRGSQNFPKELFSTSNEISTTDSLMHMAMQCGKGFRTWQYKTTDTVLCTDEVANKFNTLRQQYKNNFPIRYHFSVPLQNLKKFFFKSSLTTHRSSSAMTKVLFGLRTVLIAVSLLGLILFWRKEIAPIIFFVAFMLLFICFYVRQLEMRYLLQAEVLLFIFSGPCIGFVLQKVFAETSHAE